jgi:uncharacterized membrane protein
VARLTLGKVDASRLGDFGSSPVVSPAVLVNLMLLKISGSAVADVGETIATPLSFSADDIDNGVVKTAKTKAFTQSLASTLLSHLTLNIQALGLGMASTSVMEASVKSLVVPLGPVLDGVINQMLDALGLSLGEADVQVYGVRCSRAVLVQ